MNRGLVVLHRLADHSQIVLAIAAVLIVAFGAVLSIQQGNRVKSLDEPSFFDIGKNIGTHFRFAHTKSPEGELRPTADRAPGYPLFIAPFIRLGAEYAALRTVNFILIALTLVLLNFLLVTRYSRLAGLLGVFFVLGYPVLLYAASTLYPQSLEAFLLVATIWLLDRARSDAPFWVHALLGLAFGLLVLTIPIFVLLAPITLLWPVLSRRSQVRQVALTTGIMILLVALWMVRNYVVFRAFIPLATNSGITLLSGNCETTVYNQASAMVSWSDAVGREITGKGEVEVNRILTRVAWENMWKNPGRTFVLYWQKFFYWFAYSNKLRSDEAVPGGSGGGPTWLRDYVMLFTYGPLLALLVVRLMLIRRLPLTDLEVLFLSLYLAAGMAYAIFFTRIRYRLPFDWLLIALDAIFVARVIAGRLVRLKHLEGVGP